MKEKSTKDAILEVALELFALQGYDATSTRQIAAKSNANLSAISYHFGSKEGLYRAIFHYCFGFIEAILDSAPNAPKEKITHYATKISELHQKNPYIARLFIENVTHAKPFVSEDIAHYQGKMREFFFRALKDGVAQGIFRRDMDIPSTAIALLGVINFYFIIRASGALHSDLANLSHIYAKNALEIFFGGVEAR